MGDIVPKIDVVVVGVGFAGLYLIHRLRGEGFSVQGYERNSDVGGTWFVNRYPGARCDVESMDYSFSFDPELEQEWIWSERYAAQPEILRYIQHVADRFDLRRDVAFETEVSGATWDAVAQRWRITTIDGPIVDARYLLLATGSLSDARMPDFPGRGDFAGELLSTACWPHDHVHLAGKRVGVVGTGSSGIQVIPEIAKVAGHLTVFQRTPSFTVPARNGPLDTASAHAVKRRYREHRAETRGSFVGVLLSSTGELAGGMAEDQRRLALEEAWTCGGMSFLYTFVDTMIDPASNAVVAEFVRDKIRSIVHDPAVAARLTPKNFPIGSKRLALDTGYYDTFNRPNVTLRDLAETPIERLTHGGVQLSDGEVQLDTLVLATGFDAMTGSYLRIRIDDGTGTTLADHWRDGPRTYLGLMAAGFPNLFVIAGPGSPSVLSNMVLSIEQHVGWVAACIVAQRDGGYATIEATAQAEQDWVDQVNAVAADTLFMHGNSWYLGANVPGKPRVFMPFLGGVSVYRDLCEEVASQNYAGFERRRGVAASAAA